MNRKVVQTENAPKAIGPYSQGIISRGMLFTAGQIPVNPETGKIISDNFEHQVRQVLENIKAVVEEAGSNLTDIIKLTVYLIDLDNFQILNKVFSEYFDSEPPARAAIQVARLPLDVQVEIDAIAVVKE